jgi:hypothetical protein
MRRHTLGSVALIDGMGALLLLTLIYVGAGAIGSEIDRMEGAAMDKIALENLRAEIREIVASINMTSQPLSADSFEVGGLRFSSEPPANGTWQPFFVSGDREVRVFYITEKD